MGTSSQRYPPLSAWGGNCKPRTTTIQRLYQIYGSHRRIGPACQGLWNRRAWTPGCKIILPIGGSGGATIWIRDMVDFFTHQKFAGRLSPTGDTQNYGVEENTAGR